MSKLVTNDRISVAAGDTSITVTLAFGDATATVTLPKPAGYDALASDKQRSVASASARRILEMARTELE